MQHLAGAAQGHEDSRLTNVVLAQDARALHTEVELPSRSGVTPDNGPQPLTPESPNDPPSAQSSLLAASEAREVMSQASKQLLLLIMTTMMLHTSPCTHGPQQQSTYSLFIMHIALQQQVPVD